MYRPKLKREALAPAWSNSHRGSSANIALACVIVKLQSLAVRFPVKFTTALRLRSSMLTKALSVDLSRLSVNFNVFFWESMVNGSLVETSQAGPGNLEVTVDGGRVPTSAQAQGPHTYAISFTPREPIVHNIELRFNSQHLPGKLQLQSKWLQF